MRQCPRVLVTDSSLLASGACHFVCLAVEEILGASTFFSAWIELLSPVKGASLVRHAAAAVSVEAVPSLVVGTEESEAGLSDFCES